MLMKEFQSIGFYMSDHPLNVYKEYLEELKILPFVDFLNSKKVIA